MSVVTAMQTTTDDGLYYEIQFGQKPLTDMLKILKDLRRENSKLTEALLDRMDLNTSLVNENTRLWNWIQEQALTLERQRRELATLESRIREVNHG